MPSYSMRMKTKIQHYYTFEMILFLILNFSSIISVQSFLVPHLDASKSTKLYNPCRQFRPSRNAFHVLDSSSVTSSNESTNTTTSSSSSTDSSNESNDTGRSSSSNSSSRTSGNSFTSIGNPTPGRWEEMQGNYLLRPPNPSTEPRALIHFLGGALVGAAPDLTYRYLLERLSAQNYLIVATPYTLSFDYLQTCDAIIEKFENVAPMLARQYGPVPVVGMGHSCGALLQMLITSLFPDTPRAANALLSYNNKPVKDAVPLFEEVVAPFFMALDGNETLGRSSTEGLELGLDLARYAAKGELPPDSLLTELSQYLTPPNTPLPSPVPPTIPAPLRSTLTTFLTPAQSAIQSSLFPPLLSQSIDVLTQIPSLIHEVANGARDFVPPNQNVETAARRAYRARRTLILQYDDDIFDESPAIETLLKESETVMRMKRPMVNMDIERVILKGGHATPLLAPPSLEVAERVEDVLGEGEAKERLGYEGADETVKELVRWMEG